MAAPLALGACVAENGSMKTAALAQSAKPAANGGPDAFGYAPVRLADLADGTRIAFPSAKPDLEKLQAAEAAPKPAPAAASVKATMGARPVAVKPAAAAPLDEIAALKADVAERKTALVVMTQGKGDRITPAAATIPAAAPVPASAEKAEGSKIASATALVDPRKSVPAAISAVAKSADAVRVAAVDTTTKAVDIVQDRIGDTFKSANTITGSTAIDQMIERSAAENNIPSELAYAVVRVESHYNPTAVGGGAYGLSQIKPATARGLGFAGPAKGLFDPETNLHYGMKYLAGAWERSGHDICGTAMRYKGGHRTTTMTRAASVYCSNVKRHMAAIERRRAPANRGTLVAAAEREKQVAMAGRTVDLKARARVLAASVAAAPVALAASSKAGRAIAAAAPRGEATAAAIAATPPAAAGARGGRVRVFSDTDIGPTASNVAATGSFGYAD